MRGSTLLIVLALVFLFAFPCFADTTPAIIDTSQPQTQQGQAPATPQSQSQPAQQPQQQTTTQPQTQQDPNQSSTTPTTTTLPGINVSAGIPLVTTDQAIAKASRMTGDLHRLATTVAPMVTVLVLVIGGLLFFFCTAARVAVVWSIVGLIVVTWAIPIVGYVMNWIRA